jgi:hypothetical protein
MGDAGEGLVDAESRFQERLAEREQEQQKRGSTPPVDPEKKRKIDSLQLARIEMQRQDVLTQNPTRKAQIQQTIKDLDRQLALL